MRIILASQSASRKVAMDLLGIDYEVIPSGFDEKSIRDDNAHLLVEKLSIAKAKHVGASEKGLIVSGDLFVVHEGEFMEKPESKEEGVEMIRRLSGKTFEIVSGVCVHYSEKDVTRSSAEVCKIKFRDLSEDEIKRYVDVYPVTDFAAAFEGDAMLLFTESVEGSYNFNGFTVSKLVVFLREMGVNV